MISFTRNLKRVFADVPPGFFVEVGACHPVTDSNTYALYRRGWRGVAVEPQQGLADVWRQLRIRACASCRRGPCEIGESRWCMAWRLCWEGLIRGVSGNERGGLCEVGDADDWLFAQSKDSIVSVGERR